MTNRSQQLQREIDNSVGLASDEPKPESKPHRKRASPSALYTSWGGSDCRFYFREVSAAIGFRAQAIEPQATALGKKPTEFWDDARAKGERDARRRPKKKVRRAPALAALLEDYARKVSGEPTPALAALLERYELAPAPETATASAARPTHGRQVRVITNPERITDAHLDAVRRLRRVEAGMQRLREDSPSAYADLELAFHPSFVGIGPRTTKELTHFVGLAMRGGALVEAYERAKEKEKAPIEDWLERRLDMRGELLGQEKEDMVLDDGKATLTEVLQRAREEAEQTAIEAIRAFEAVTDKPPEVKQEERAAAEKAAAKERGEPVRRGARRRSSVAHLFDPPEFGPQGGGSA